MMSDVIYLGALNVPLYGLARGTKKMSGQADQFVAVADLLAGSSNRIRVLPSCIGDADSDEPEGRKVGDTIHASLAGGNFTSANQPANDGIEVLSDTEEDVGRVVTIYYTAYGTGIVKMEQVTLHATDGRTAVASVDTTMGYVLGAEVSEAHETAVITIREASGNQAVTTIAATVTQAGVHDVKFDLFGLPFAAVLDSTGAQIVGAVGRDPAGNTIYGSATLNGTTAALANQGFESISKLLVGCVPHPGSGSDRHVTFKVGGLVWEAGADLVEDAGAAQDKERAVLPSIRIPYVHWVMSDATGADAPGGEKDRLIIRPYVNRG